MNQIIKKRIEEINSGRVPEGYKQTPFGIFPYDWELDKTLKDFALINPKTSKLPIEFLYIDLESVIDGRIVKENIINRNNAPSRAQRVLSENDVIYQMVRPYQRNNLIFHNSNKDIPSVASTGYAQLRSNTPSFLFQTINSDYFCEQVLSKCTGTNYPAINSEDLGTIMIAYPKNKTEQGKIAEILMKWDEMVELQDQYLKKLEIRKKAVMKKLLTPKADWKDFSIFELGELYQPITISNNQLQENGYKVYGANGLIGFYDKYNHENSEIAITCRGSTCGNVILTEPKSWITGNAMVFKVKNCYDKKFLFYMCTNRGFKDIVSGSGQPQITRQSLNKVILRMPAIKSEQELISKTLESVDKEISLQKEKLDKIKTQRKILQQYLLTGIVRMS